MKANDFWPIRAFDFAEENKRKDLRCSMKKTEEDEISSDINSLLEDKISVKERAFLTEAKKRLEKKEYFPQIIGNLERELTPMAMHHELTESVGKFYLKIISHRFKGKGFRRGGISVGWVSF